MKIKKGIIPGILIGSIATAGAVVGSALTYRQKVIQPVSKKECKIEENRKRANRKALSSRCH